jgi:DNA mismatch repair protein MutS
MALVQDYLDLTQKYKAEYGEKTLVLMEVGSFFEVYALIKPDGTYTGSNIADFAKINEMVIAKKNTCVGKLPVVMAGMGTAYADKYIQKLQEHNYTIVIYKQDAQQKTSRSLAEIISPGTYFPMETDSAILTNNIMCIWLHKSTASKTRPCQVTIGLANIDIYTGKTALFQFVANYIHSPATYDELERYVAAYHPSECLLVGNLADHLVTDIIGFVGLENTKLHRGQAPAPPLAEKDIRIGNVDNTTSPYFGKSVETNPPPYGKTKTKSSTTLTTPSSPPHPAGGVWGGTPHRNAEKQIYQMELLKRFFPQCADTFLDMFPTHSIAIQAFCLLLDFVDQHNPNLSKKLSEPRFENYTDRLILANHSLSQLNITDDARHTGKMRSVSALLNNCVTTMGKRQFMYNLHYPLTHKPTLQTSYAMTAHLLQKGEPYFLLMRTELSAIGDLEKFSRKIITRKLQPKNLTALDDDLTHLDSLQMQLQADAVLQTFLRQTNGPACISTACRTIQAELRRVFDLEACRNLADVVGGGNIIKRGVSAPLDAVMHASLDGGEKLKSICHYLSVLIQQSEKKNTAAVKIHEPSKSSAVLLCTSRRAALLKAAISKKKNTTLRYISLFTQTEESFDLDLAAIECNPYSKSELVVTSKEIRAIAYANEEANLKLTREMELVFQNYITEFAKFENELTTLIKYTTEIDLLQCKAYTAHKYNYCRPNLDASADSKAYFRFTGIRHPLIEHLQTNEIYVTNDLALGAAQTAAPANGMLLYGTNAVGKTSFIKSVGIAIIMAQAGLYVPCNSFTYQPYRNVFTRILGNDNLFKGLSTFAVEMTELRTILTMADDSSLVLGDELCSGTESDSALSIFTAGLESLHAKESTFIFATHLHEINRYEEITNLQQLKMMHMAVHYDKESQLLIYDRKLREGPGESMYGLEVCKALNLPEAFLARAHALRMKYHPEKQNVLGLSPTHYNAKKLVGNCELCQKYKASEVHHLQHQKKAQQNDYILNEETGQNFHKNHAANLLSICEACHKKIHKTNAEHKVVKTSEGYKVIKI